MMITNNDYDKSVLVAVFIKEIRDRMAERKNITDVLFTPLIGGYEVSFFNGKKSVRVIFEVKGFFIKKLIIKKYVDGKETAMFKAVTKEEVSRYVEIILTE